MRAYLQIIFLICTVVSISKCDCVTKGKSCDEDNGTETPNPCCNGLQCKYSYKCGDKPPKSCQNDEECKPFCRDKKAECELCNKLKVLGTSIGACANIAPSKAYKACFCGYRGDEVFIHTKIKKGQNCQDANKDKDCKAWCAPGNNKFLCPLKSNTTQSICVCESNV